VGGSPPADLGLFNGEALASRIFCHPLPVAHNGLVAGQSLAGPTKGINDLASAENCGVPKVHGLIVWSFDLARFGIRPSGSILRSSPRSVLEAVVPSNARHYPISPVGPIPGSRAAREFEAHSACWPSTLVSNLLAFLSFAILAQAV